MGKLEKLARERAHIRTVETSTFAVDETHILSTGRLKDVRFFFTSNVIGENHEPGTLHDLSVHLLIRTPDLVIEDVEVSIDTVPRSDCEGLERSLDGVKGLAIKGGFSAKVKELAGGKRGCTHLVHLLVTMAPAILQGHWALQDRTPPVPGEAARARAAASAKFLKDSCYAWREEGNSYRALLSIAEGK
jgi:hypothetical protein